MRKRKKEWLWIWSDWKRKHVKYELVELEYIRLDLFSPFWHFVLLDVWAFYCLWPHRSVCLFTLFLSKHLSIYFYLCFSVHRIIVSLFVDVVFFWSSIYSVIDNVYLCSFFLYILSSIQFPFIFMMPVIIIRLFMFYVWKWPVA